MRTISATTQPADHMSALQLYSLKPYSSSGARYHLEGFGQLRSTGITRRPSEGMPRRRAFPVVLAQHAGAPEVGQLQAAALREKQVCRRHVLLRRTVGLARECSSHCAGRRERAL